jgi:alpha-ribazole phosphatase/probable phosphoglycerate mutase
MTKLVFFAHSTTLDNEEHKATGWLQGELSAKGMEQAQALPTLLKDASFEIVFSSDLHRAIQSAELSFKDTHPIRHDWRLREANYGDLDGTEKNFKKDMNKFINTPYPGGESYKDAEKRLRSFLADIKKFFPDGYVAVIGHEATQLAIEVILNGKTWEQVIAENWRPQGKWQPGWFYEV